MYPFGPAKPGVPGSRFTNGNIVIVPLGRDGVLGIVLATFMWEGQRPEEPEKRRPSPSFRNCSTPGPWAFLLTLSGGDGLLGAVQVYRCQICPAYGRSWPVPGRSREENLAPWRGLRERHRFGFLTGKASTRRWHSRQGGLESEKPSWWPHAA